MEDPRGILKVVGRRIAQARRAAGLTQEGLAERSNLSPNMISLVETGKTAASLLTLDALAHGLGMPLAQIVMDEDASIQEIAAILGGKTLDEKRRTAFIIRAMFAPLS